MLKRMKYQLPVISLFLLFLFCFPVYAGSINGNEQSVISVAQGQFEYNGETYRAKQEYVSALIGYLQRDEVDLSAADAQSAISQIYANVQTGVEAGYLEKVGGSSGPGDETSAGQHGSENGESGGNSGGSENGSNGSAGSTVPSSDGTTIPSSNLGENQNPNQSNQSQGQDDGSAGQSAVSPDNQTPGTGNDPSGASQEGDSTPGGDPSTEGMTSSEVSTRQKPEKEVEKPEEIRILENIAQAGEYTGAADLSLNLSPGASPSSSLNSSIGIEAESSLPSSKTSPESQESPNNTNTIEDRLFPFDYKTVLLYVLSALLVISIILGIIIFTKHLNRYHHRSKNLRKAVRSIGGVNLAAATFIILFTAGLGLGVLRDTVFQESIDETGYYDEVYEDFIKVNVSAFDFLKVPEEVFKNSVSYEQVSMAARQQMENDLHRGTYQVNVSVFSNRIKNRVRDYIRDQELPMTQSSRKGLDLICQYLESEYTALFHWKYASMWGGWHEDFMVALRWLLPMSLLLFLAGHLIIITTHHFKHRGIRQCGFGIGAGAAIYLIFNIVTKFITGGKGAQGETYVDEFLFHFLRQGNHVGLLIGLVGVCFALGYLALAKATKEGVK